MPGFRLTLFTVFFAMALIAYMPAPACGLPGEAGKATEPASEVTAGATLSVSAARSFQAGRGLPADGTIGSRVVPASRPASASLPAKAYEIDPGPAP